MNQNDLLKYIHQPEQLDQESLENLQELLREFPYFQTGHLLLLKNLHNVKSIRFDSQLKYSSVFAHDRSVLYHLLHAGAQPEEIEASRPGTEEESIPAGDSKTEEKTEELTVSVDETTGDQTLSPAEPVEAVSPEEPESRKEALAEQVLRRVAEIRGDAGGPPDETPAGPEEKAESPGQEEQGEGEESVADRILREVREAKLRKQEVTGEEPVPAGSREEETPAESGEHADVPPVKDEAELFTLAEDDPSLKEEPEDTVQPSTGEILEIDEPEEGNPEPAESSSDGSSRQDISQQTEKPAEKKTPVVNESDRQTAGGESHSFAQWLDRMGTKPAPSSPPGTSLKNNPRQDDLIDRFLEVNPRIVPRQHAEPDDQEVEDISRPSVEENEGMLTDTLAQIYIRQGYYSRAIFAYEKLSLKFPEKSSYFASQIEKIKELIKRKSK